MFDASAFDNHIREISEAAEGKRIDRDEVVVESWLRCINDHKLDPQHKGKARIVTENTLRHHQQEAEDLLNIARFAIEDLYQRVNRLGYVLLLTDAKGVTVDFIGDDKVDRELKRAGLYIGSEWSEKFAGTCGVGACIASGEPLTIHQMDHFDMAHAELSCTAAPIHHPNGSLIGVLDVSLLTSGREKHTQGLTLEVVKSCVRNIELANLMGSKKSDWILRLSKMPEFLGVDPSCAVSVGADGKISGYTSAAHRLFASTLGTDWKKEPVFIGKDFEEIFEFDFNSIPDLMNAEVPGEQALEMINNEIIFADVRAPIRRAPIINRAAKTNPLSFIHGGDRKMTLLAEKAVRVIDKQISIILEGETGVGKEFVARAIHEASKKKGPFVPINCASIPETLIESELFGYAPNSFTGANLKGKKGLIEKANGGTLFLDEIGDMPLALQARLLRVLAEREVMAVGSTKAKPVTIRVISASHRHLKGLVESGQFRQDLYYRLNGLILEIPALRDRTDKTWLIKQLTGHLAKGGSLSFSKEAQEKLLQFPWPGNVRELINVIELCQAMCEGQHVCVQDLPEHIICPQVYN